MVNNQLQGICVEMPGNQNTQSQFPTVNVNQNPIQGIPISPGQQVVYAQPVNGTAPQAISIRQPVQPRPIAIQAPIRFGHKYILKYFIYFISSVMIHCPYCQADGPTFVDYEIGPMLYI